MAHTPGHVKSTAEELEAVARIVEAALGGKQAGKNSVTEAQDAAAEGYGDAGNWERVKAKYNLQIYSKNNRFYFGLKDKPADIDWLKVLFKDIPVTLVRHYQRPDKVFFC